MRRHKIIWTITAVVLLSAASVAVLRQAVTSPAPPERSAEELLIAVLDVLDADPAAWENTTQAMVRRAASRVEAGEIRSAEAYYVLAVQYQREWNLSGAESLYKRAIASRPDWALPYTGLGGLLGRHMIGRTREAIEVLDKAIELDPKSGRPHNVLAVVLRIGGRISEAEKEAREALRLEPENIACHNNYANLQVALGDFDEAEKHYRIAHELIPEHPKPYYNLACMYALQGRLDEALAHLKEALQRSSELRRDAYGDPDLENLRENPEFLKMVLGNGTSADTPNQASGGDSEPSAPAAH